MDIIKQALCNGHKDNPKIEYCAAKAEIESLRTQLQQSEERVAELEDCLKSLEWVDPT